MANANFQVRSKSGRALGFVSAATGRRYGADGEFRPSSVEQRGRQKKKRQKRPTLGLAGYRLAARAYVFSPF